MQIATANVQRDVWTVDDTVKQRKEVWNNAFHLVGDKHLVAIELNLVACELNVRLNAWEIEDAREVERIVYVKVNPEQGFVLHGIERAVEALVVFVFQCAGRLCPQWFYVVDDVVFIGFHVLAVFPFGLLAEGYGHSHKLAVLVEQFLNLLFLQKLLAVVVDVKDDVRTAVGFLGLFQRERRTSVTAPLNGLSPFAVALGDNLHFLGYHEGRIEAQTKVSDNLSSVLFILLHEVGNARKGYLVDIFVYFFGSHTNAAVADGERTCLLVQAYVNRKVALFTLEVALKSKCLQLLCGVDSVADHLAQEDFVV